MNKKFPNCPNCDGSGYLTSYRLIKAKGRGADEYHPTSSPCLCLRNHQLVTKYPQLSAVEPSTLETIEYSENYYNHSFYHFVGSYNKYLSLIKAFLAGNKKPPEKNLIISSNDFINEFFMPKDLKDGDNKSITDNIYFDYMFLSLNCNIIRPSTKMVIADVVLDRVSRKKPLWVFTDFELNSAKEFSAELEDIMDGVFKKVNTANLPFSGSEKTQREAESDLQNNAGNF